MERKRASVRPETAVVNAVEGQHIVEPLVVLTAKPDESWRERAISAPVTHVASRTSTPRLKSSIASLAAASSGESSDSPDGKLGSKLLYPAHQ